MSSNSIKRFVSRRIGDMSASLAPFRDSYPEAKRYTHPERGAVVPTPEAPLMPFIDSARHLQNPSYETPDYFVSILEDALFCPANNVLMANRRSVVPESINSVRTTRRFRPTLGHVRRPVRISGYATPLRSASNEFYHTVVSNMSPLFGLWSECCLGLERIQLIIAGEPTSTEQFFLERLLPPNVELVRVEPNRLLNIEQYVFLPFLNRQYAGYLPERYMKHFASRVSPSKERTSSRRIFISRDGAEKRRLINEAEVFAVAKAHGFEKHRLEEMSLENQIELFNDADMVMGMHGAGFTNLIHARNCDVFEIFPRARVKPTFYFLGKSCGHAYHYLCGDGATMMDNVALDHNQVGSVDRAVACEQPVAISRKAQRVVHDRAPGPHGGTSRRVIKEEHS